MFDVPNIDMPWVPDPEAMFRGVEYAVSLLHKEWEMVLRIQEHFHLGTTDDAARYAITMVAKSIEDPVKNEGGTING